MMNTTARQTFKLLNHIYWHSKPSFAMEVDTYPYWTMFAVVEGRFAYGISKYEGEAAYGDLVFCPPNVPFRRSILEPLSFHFYSFDFQSEEESTNVPRTALPVGKVTLFDHDRLASNYHYMNRWQADDESVSLDQKTHFLQDLWHLYCMEREAIQEKSRADSMQNSTIHEITTWLQRNAFNQISLKRIADTHFLTPVQLTRQFKAVHGLTPIQYLTSIRLRKAKALLLETNQSLEHIAQQCGYENGFYFSRVFMKKMGMTPSQFRKMYKL